VRKALWFLGHLWALPVTTLGIVLALPLARLHAVDREGIFHFVVRARGPLGWYVRRFRIAAFTLGAVVTYADPEGPRQPRLVRHEREHVVQTFVFGPLFLPVYGLASLWQWVRGGHAYRDNVFEVRARMAEASVKQELRLVRPPD
jgi:hypothetical protein